MMVGRKLRLVLLIVLFSCILVACTGVDIVNDIDQQEVKDDNEIKADLMGEQEIKKSTGPRGDATGEPPLGDMAAKDRQGILDKANPSLNKDTQGMQMPAMDNNNELALANGPYSDRLLFTTSTNGASWDESFDIILEHASVPDALILDKNIGSFVAGDIVSVFVDARDLVNGPGNEKIGMIVSSDQGSSWSDVRVLEIVGSENHVPVDPSIVQLEDGRLLLYYFDFTVKMNPLIDGSDKEYVMYVASSNDGVVFNSVSAAYVSDVSITDPEVVYFDEKWLMFVAREDGMQVLVGEDPYSFSFDSDLDILGIPGTVVVEDELWLYGCESSGMIPYVSLDGIVFEKSKSFVKSGPSLPACDPAPLYFGEGEFGLVAKAFPVK